MFCSHCGKAVTQLFTTDVVPYSVCFACRASLSEDLTSSIQKMIGPPTMDAVSSTSGAPRSCGWCGDEVDNTYAFEDREVCWNCYQQCNVQTVPSPGPQPTPAASSSVPDHYFCGLCANLTEVLHVRKGLGQCDSCYSKSNPKEPPTEPHVPVLSMQVSACFRCYQQKPVQVTTCCRKLVCNDCASGCLECGKIRCNFCGMRAHILRSGWQGVLCPRICYQKVSDRVRAEQAAQQSAANPTRNMADYIDDYD